MDVRLSLSEERLEARIGGEGARGLRRIEVSREPVGSEIGVSGVGLLFPEHDVSFDQWRRVGVRIAKTADLTAWCLGDWLAYGESAFAGRYRQAADLVGLSYQTLRNYAWVARRFALSRRRDSLTFNHHMVVARLTTEQQDFWLDRALGEKWSVHRLRARLSEHEAPGKKMDEPAGAALSKVSVNRQRLSRWQAAARRANSSLEEWAVATLDLVADQELAGSPEGDESGK